MSLRPCGFTETYLCLAVQSSNRNSRAPLHFLYNTRTICRESFFRAERRFHHSSRVQLGHHGIKTRIRSSDLRADGRCVHGLATLHAPSRHSRTRKFHGQSETTSDYRATSFRSSSSTKLHSQNEFTEASSDDSSQRSTLSFAEQQAFASLFRSLSDRTRKGERSQETLDVRRNRHIEGKIKKLDDDFRELEESSDDNMLLDNILDEIQLAQAPSVKSQPMTITPADTAMELASGEIVQGQNNRVSARLETLSPELRREMEELRRIEDSMYLATTDVHLWQILEHEVFPSMRRIQMENDRTLQKRAIKPSDTEASLAGTDVDAGKTAISPKFPHYVQAYPALLLLAMRLAARRVTYTPFVTSLIPYIKSIGISAYALGVSTGLYNELLHHKWRVYSDTFGMLAVLREMQSSGLPFDAKTLQVLQEAANHFNLANRGDLGLASKDMVHVPNERREFLEIKAWTHRVRKQIDERAIDRARRMEYERMLRAEENMATEGKGLIT